MRAIAWRRCWRARRALLGPALEHGVFFAPCAYEIDGIELLEREVFGPILHVVHAFQKKSKTGIKTPKFEVDLIRDRLKRLRKELLQ